MPRALGTVTVQVLTAAGVGGAGRALPSRTGLLLPLVERGPSCRPRRPGLSAPAPDSLGVFCKEMVDNLCPLTATRLLPPGWAVGDLLPQETPAGRHGLLPQATALRGRQIRGGRRVRGLSQVLIVTDSTTRLAGGEPEEGTPRRGAERDGGPRGPHHVCQHMACCPAGRKPGPGRASAQTPGFLSRRRMIQG